MGDHVPFIIYGHFVPRSVSKIIFKFHFFVKQLPLNARHIISCCKRVSGEINARHDIVVNILLNNILIQRGLITHEQKWDERKMVRTASDEITIGAEHWRSDDWKEKG